MMKWLPLFMLFVVPCAAQVQVDTIRLGPREKAPSGRFFIEAGASTVPLQLGRGHFARFRMGRQPDKGGYIFFSATIMTNTLKEEYTYHIAGDPYNTEYQGDRVIQNMTYAGLHYEYIFSATFVSAYLGIGVIFGHYGYNSSCPNLGPCQAGPTFGMEPEFGLRIQPLPFLQVRAGLGTLLAIAFHYDQHRPNAALSIGLRGML